MTEMKFDPVNSIKSMYSDSKHVMSVSYKPDIETFKRTLKVVLIGIILLGILGFIIYLIINNLILVSP
ncbi:MAG: protein translocase SEC61 complex subunit gamma [Candidatus Micrarchaeaceae archaeon]